MTAPLPRLRQDLQLLPARASDDGAPAWMLFDPLRNAYFRIGRRWFDLLRAWDADGEVVRRRVAAESGRTPGEGELGAFARFLGDNGLHDEAGPQTAAHLAAQAGRGRHGPLGTLVHNYLFFRVPLWRPDRFLAFTHPIVAPLLTRPFAVTVAILGVLALWLVSRQWDAFLAQSSSAWSLEGLVSFLLALAVVKVLHELGHAFMARRFGLSVPVMGIAFLVLMPVLYTDTTHAWRLTRRRDRLLVDGAGIFTELAVAVFATWAWLLLEDGPPRAAAFSLATAGWTMSLLINLNPFMRFDGYHLLADGLGVENLQARGFALGRWRLRELLFALGDPVPEPLPAARRRLLIAHAWGTWIYRFFLFVGIAILVYAFFIKVIAIALFVVEIVWFIALPVWREGKVWWTRRADIARSPRGWTTVATTAFLVFLSFVPLSRTVSVPAVLAVEQEVRLFAPRAGTLVQHAMLNGRTVDAGERLALLRDEEIDLRARSLAMRLALLETRIARAGADAEEATQLPVLQRERKALLREVSAVDELRDGLVLRAPFAGVLADIDPTLHDGRALARTDGLGMLRAHGGPALRGLVRERDLGRLATGATGRFVPDDPALPSRPVVLTQLADTAAASFDEPLLATSHGGPVPARAEADGVPVPQGAFYGAILRPEGSTPMQAVRGVAVLSAEGRSLAGGFFRRLAALAIRESGF